MGAGKSTIGRLLAKALNLPFYDSDREIEVRTGASIPLIFELEGEAGFRDREQQVLADLCQEQGMVLATGGGAILRAENREQFSQQGFVIYLSTSVAHQIARTSRDRNRPLLQTDNPAQVLTELLKIRHPLYQAVADLVIETDERPPKYVVQEIISHLKQRAVVQD